MRAAVLAMVVAMALTTACADQRDGAPTAAVTVAAVDAPPSAAEAPPPAVPPGAVASAPPEPDAATAAPPATVQPTTPAQPPAATKPPRPTPPPAPKKPAATKPEPATAAPATPPPATPAPATPPPAPAAAPTSAGATAEIKTLWSKKCASCHGGSGQAGGKMAEKMAVESMASSAWQGRFTDAQLKQAVIDGVNREKDGVTQKMKGYSLTPAELDGLVALMRSFR